MFMKMNLKRKITVSSPAIAKKKLWREFLFWLFCHHKLVKGIKWTSFHYLQCFFFRLRHKRFIKNVNKYSFFVVVGWKKKGLWNCNTFFDWLMKLIIILYLGKRGIKKCKRKESLKKNFFLIVNNWKFSLVFAVYHQPSQNTCVNFRYFIRSSVPNKYVSC